MKTTLRQLVYFIAAAEQGSTVAAAQALNVSQPSVSAALLDLEANLGAALFLRHRARGLALTPFGREKLDEARRLVADAASFESGPDQVGTGVAGQLAIAFFSTLGPLCLPAILTRLKRQHPRLEPRLREGDLAQVRDSIEMGAAEIGLTYDVGLGGALAGETLAEFQPHALLPAGHKLAKHRQVSLADLASEPFILFGLPHSREFLLAPFRHHGLDPKLAYECSSLEMVRGLVAAGHGVSLLMTRPLVDASYDGSKLACRDIREKLPPQRVLAIGRDLAKLSRPAAAFLEAARGHFH